VDQETPILVRPDEDQHRYVLLDGLHRLEACKALGEATIMALVGSAGDLADERPSSPALPATKAGRGHRTHPGNHTDGQLARAARRLDGILDRRVDPFFSETL
jgi:hypothetical protein